MINRLFGKVSHLFLTGLIIGCTFFCVPIVSSAENIISGPRIVVSEADTIQDLQTGQEVIFRDQATLRKLLNDLQIPLYHQIPALGISSKDLQDANQLALLAIDKIKSENEANKAQGYDAGWQFRNAVGSWAWRVQALARTKTDVNKLVAAARFVSKDGTVYFNEDELASAALLAGVSDPIVQGFKKKAAEYREKGEFRKAHTFYYAAAIGGDAQALSELVQLLRIEQGVPVTVYSGIRLLATLRPEGTLQVMRKFVREYKEKTHGSEEEPRERLTWVGITIATVYLLAYGDENDRLLLANLPLSENVLGLHLFWSATENAGDLFFEQFSSSWRGNTYRYNMYCASFLYRNRNEVDSLVSHYNDMTLRAAYNPEDIDRIAVLSVQLYEEKQLSRCLLSNSVASDIWEIHKENYSDSLTWVKQDGLFGQYSTILNNMKIQETKLTMIDYFDDEVMKDSDSEFDKVDPLYLNLLRAYLRLSENIHVLDKLNANTKVGRGEKRVVYRSVLSGSTDIALAMTINILPRISDNKLQVGVQLDTRFGIGISSGLSVIISKSDEKIAAYQENFGQSLIDRVVLEKDGKQLSLNFIKTTQGGTHIYELPSDKYEKLQGLLSVQMKSFDDEWHLNFPLKYSQYALRHRLSSAVQE